MKQRSIYIGIAGVLLIGGTALWWTTAAGQVNGPVVCPDVLCDDVMSEGCVPAPVELGADGCPLNPCEVVCDEGTGTNKNEQKVEQQQNVISVSILPSPSPIVPTETRRGFWQIVASFFRSLIGR